jgi:hypothetical protein
MPSPVPLATTGNAAFLTSSGALLQGAVNPNGEATSYWFEYGTTDSYGQLTPSASAGSGLIELTIGAQLTGLAPDTTYHFRLVAQSAGGTSHGADGQFTTRSAPPTAATGAASSVTSTAAFVTGSVDPNGRATAYWFEYGTEPFYGTQTPSGSAGSGFEAVGVGVELTGLLPATRYYYRLVAENEGGTSFGARGEFTTASIPPAMGAVSAPTLRLGRLVGGAIPLELFWSATPGSAAICGYDVYMGSAGLAAAAAGAVNSSTLSTSSRPARGLYYRVGAVACDGAASTLAESPTVDLRILQESTSALRRGTGWMRLTAAGASGGHVLSTTRDGARLTLSFSGRSFALVAPQGPRYGAVSVSIDGAAGTRIGLRRSSRAQQIAVFVAHFETVGPHKVVIRARTVTSRRRVDIDGFAVVS